MSIDDKNISINKTILESSFKKKRVSIKDFPAKSTCYTLINLSQAS